MTLKISSRLRATLEVWLFSMVLFALFRAAFYLFFYHQAEAFSPSEIVFAALLGLRFDIRLATLLVLPILIFAIPTRWHWRGNQKARRVWVSTYTGLFSLLLLIYLIDFGYYSYLQSRVNISIFQFLVNPSISLEMAHETYNMYLWVPLFFGVVFLIFRFFNFVIFGQGGRHARPEPLHARTVRSLQGLVLTLASLLGLYGSVSQYPLRWSEAFFTQNMFVAYLSMNPVHYLFDSIESRKQTYDQKKVEAAYPVVAKYLGVENPQSLVYRRNIETRQLIKFNRPPNIVYIVMESMAAYKSGLFGNAPDSSPSLDQLAKSDNGWLFRPFYTPTEGTARSVFCVLTGIPDINAKSSSSRNPLIVNQHTLINALEGYEKYYFIGGSANWGNIRGVYMNNIPGLQMYEGDSTLVGPRTDVWGLSDLDLFRATATKLNERDPNKPFFALVQSASFHRPYTIPPEHGNFQLKTLTTDPKDKNGITSDQLSQLGFYSIDEYNSFRFADYSLGEFFRLIKDTEFFKNTIFVIHGDHGLPHNGATHLSEGYRFYGLNRFHVPLVIYSPLINHHEEYTQMMSETDVWPTLLGSLGKQYPNQALGRNVLALPKGQSHYALSYVYYSDPLQIMLYDQDFIVFGTEKKVDALYRYNGHGSEKQELNAVTAESYKINLKDQYPEKFKEMSDLLTGLFETSRFLLYHNPRIK